MDEHLCNNAGKYNQGEVSPNSRFGEKQVEVMHQKGLLTKISQVMDIAREVGCTPAQLALAYCLKNNQVSSILFGAKKVTQLEENIRTLEILPRIDQEVMTRLRHLES
jgi:aryl-alcohol dehydrogenase-like predicted oxidoreductase